ncbi:trimethylamine methyltransferase family protein [Desulforhopalus singaporensis]|uniref:Methyltransferase n=1 Tax=Desulforhopalus singaporensis TaxID=91360 RepID=A0A1H0N7X5_9BACT|nr:trimethylamine methyltransferase family protein [Desulforhopalus singaporensis]SDO88772.1 trimethylamine---corrinoid protein Co-methyltransferase [Desulforhopalus singaporensis]
MRHFEYFSQEEVQRVHEASLKVLEETGLDFGYEPAVAVLREAGCRVEGKRVFFPPKLVEEMIAKAPAEFTLYGRNPDKNVVIGGDNIAYIPCYGSPIVTDLDRGRRESIFEDYKNFVKLSYASKVLDITGGMMAEPGDLPNDRRNAEMMYASMKYSDKPFMGGATNGAAAKETIEMASLVFGGEQELAKKPRFISILCSLTPLSYDESMLGAIMEYARAGMPQLISSLSIAGATAPVTMEGTLVVQNAEILAGIVLTQIIRPGTPVVYSGSSSNAAMRYGTLSIGSPENAVNVAATAQMARFYSLPCRGGGTLTDSKSPDAQAGLESMMSHLMATVAGVNFVLHSAGILEGYLVSSYEKFIIDDEICGMCKRIKKGEQITAENLAIDVIDQVGPGGEYLTNAHTFRNFRQSFYQPEMESRENYDTWKKNGSLTYDQVANRKWKEILEKYVEPSLPEESEKALQDYIADKYGR